MPQYLVARIANLSSTVLLSSPSRRSPRNRSAAFALSDLAPSRPIFFLDRPDGSQRLAMDYRQLKKNAVIGHFPMALVSMSQGYSDLAKQTRNANY